MIHKMYVALGALLFGAMTVQAQSSVVAGGCDAKNAENVTMGISIGQLAVETFKNGNSLLLGIQQDFSRKKHSTAVRDVTVSDFSVSVVGREIIVANVKGQRVAVYDEMGRCVALFRKAEGTVTTTVANIGVYIVMVNNQQQNVIVKN